MKRLSYRAAVCAAALAGTLAASTLVSAQGFGGPDRRPIPGGGDVAITNVRIIVGSGAIYDSGTILVRAGRIAAVASGSLPVPEGMRVVDGKGMTAMPGFIDGHKHVNNGDQAAAQMRSLLEAGYTTVLAGGGQADANIALRDRIDKGEFIGPRIIPSGQIGLNQTPAAARAAVQELAKKGVKYTGEIGLTPEPFPPQAQVEVLKAIVDEAKKVGVQVNVHAVSSIAMTTAIDVGVTRLVHLPNKDYTTFDQADRVAETGSIVSGLIAFGAPIIDRESPAPAQVQFPRDNTTRFRDGKPWPEAIAGANRDAKGRATGTEAGYEIINARRIWDASPDHTTMSWSTDQNYADTVVLEHELKSFSIVFSMADIFRIMGPNSAKFVGMEDQIGTLETGKIADIILLDGNPENIYGLLKTKVVIRDGKVLIDKRQPAAATAPRATR
jgi:imidazolonepropionase-like amidohydrolase